MEELQLLIYPKHITKYSHKDLLCIRTGDELRIKQYWGFKKYMSDNFETFKREIKSPFDHNFDYHTYFGKWFQREKKKYRINPYTVKILIRFRITTVKKYKQLYEYPQKQFFM